MVNEGKARGYSIGKKYKYTYIITKLLIEKDKL
jgi:hypothetical protein